MLFGIWFYQAHCCAIYLRLSFNDHHWNLSICPHTTLKLFSSTKQYLQGMKMQCSDCNTVMFKLPQVGYAHANTAMPYGVKTGSTDNSKTEDDMWREKWAGKPSVNMTNYVEVCKRNRFLQKQHTTWRKKIFRNESSVAGGKPEQKPRARRTWKYLFFFFDTLRRVYTSIFPDLLI